MRIADRIYVASHAGPVGSALLRSGGYANLITRSNAELDLTDLRATRQFSANQDFLETQMAGADLPAPPQSRQERTILNEAI